MIIDSYRYSAPWSLPLILISAITTVLCVGVSLFILGSGEGREILLALLPIAVVAVAALFTVRGYTLTAEFLRVHRLLWSTRIPLAGLQSVAFDPLAIHKSLRLFGNGGLYSISGFFRSKKLGRYRAFLSHAGLAVILRFPERTIAVSPGNPKGFIQQIEQMVPLPDSSGSDNGSIQANSN